MDKHTFRYGDTLESGCLQCGRPIAHYRHWTEEDDKVMDTIEELEKVYSDMYTPGALKPIISHAIAELKESRDKIPPDWHVSPRWIGVAQVGLVWLKRLLKLPPDHYVERIWQDGQEGCGGNFHVVIVGPKCPQTLYGERIPEIQIVMHADEKHSEIRVVVHDDKKRHSIIEEPRT